MFVKLHSELRGSKTRVLNAGSADKIVAFVVALLIHSLAVVFLLEHDDTVEKSQLAGAVRGEARTALRFVSAARSSSQYAVNSSYRTDESYRKDENMERTVRPIEQSSFDSAKAGPNDAETASPRLHSQALTATAGSPEGGQASMGEQRNSEELDDMKAIYINSVRAAIERRWTELTGQALPVACSIVLEQSTGGAVTGMEFDECSLDRASRTQLEVAIQKAQPLPYAGFESVFEPHMVFELGQSR
jgi:colicin import membrane protein